MEIIIGYVCSYGFILAVFLLTFLCQKYKLVREEGSRKMIHILVCFTWVIMEKCFSGSIHTVIIPLTFIVVNALSMKIHLIPGMDRKEGDSYGTVYYAVSLTIMNLVAYFNADFVLPAGIGLFALSFGDGFAALIGKMKHPANRKLKPGKSLFGTLACFGFAFLGIELLNLLLGGGIALLLALLLALITSALEFYGGKWDNLLIPLGIFICAYGLLPMF